MEHRRRNLKLTKEEDGWIFIGGEALKDNQATERPAFLEASRPRVSKSKGPIGDVCPKE
ncbi:hypothetical protein Ancab_029121 [Ancistrocladus abbreviatus]